MRKMPMTTDWRVVQLFLSSVGVFEVEIDVVNKDLRCTCPLWAKRSDCKHSRFVSEKLAKNNGQYSIVIPDNVDEDEAVAAHEDPVKFREFLIKYSKIEVLP